MIRKAWERKLVRSDRGIGLQHKAVCLTRHSDKTEDFVRLHKRLGDRINALLITGRKLMYTVTAVTLQLY